MNHYFYICDICEYQYDEEITGMLWEQIPKDWTCTSCGASKKSFKLIEVSNAHSNIGFVQESNRVL